MAEEFIQDNTKKQQIDKIFQVIDKNKDNKEICKIAFDTLNSKCLENPSIIFPIMTNFLALISRCNLKLIEDGNPILLNFFQDFGNKELIKILADNDIKKNLLSLLKEEKTEYPFYINPMTNNLEQLTNISYMTMDFFKKDFDISKYAPLYKEDSNSINNKNPLGHGKSEEIFSKDDIDILFHNDQNLKKKLYESFENKNNKSKEEDEDDDMNDINNKSQISVEEVYKKYSKNYDMKLNASDDTTDIINNPRKKIRKLNDNSKEISINITFYPFFGFMMEILKDNHMPYHTQRICSITLLQLLEKQFDKLLYYPYEIKINLLSDYSDILSVNIYERTKFKKYEKIKEILQINMMTQFLYNSIIDKVFDSCNTEYICLLKDINLKVLSSVINNFNNEKIKKEFYQKTIMLLKIFKEYKGDWQPLFAILTLYKYISFNSDGSIFVEFDLFNILNTIMNTDKEEIRDLIIKILDKTLAAEMINQINVEIIMDIFNKFIGLIHNYDDIDIGVKDYFSCLYNFTNYFRKRPQIKEICFQKFQTIFKNDDFIFHSLNKMTDVRIKFYEVIEHLIVDGFTFDKDILEKLILMSFQGLCLEENKILLKTQKDFLINVLYYNNGDINTFERNSNIIFYLFLTKNISKVENLYYPMEDDTCKSLIVDLYKSFFLNDAQQNEIKIKYEQKITNIIPIIALLIRIKTQFIELIYNNLNIHFPNSLNNDVKNMPLSPELLLFFRIVLFYLRYIENDTNKTLLINDDILQYFSELSNLKEMAIHIQDDFRKNNLLSCVNIFKKFSFENLKTVPQQLEEVIFNLKNNKLCPIRALNDAMKEIYKKIQEKKNDQLIKACCDKAKKINDCVISIEKSQNTSELRLKIRGYVSACLFMHWQFKGQKTDKISSITNSFLNCLKINNKESDTFVNYLVSFLSTIHENKNTFNKIIFTFFENNIKMCQDLVYSNEDKIQNKKSGNINNGEDKCIEKLKQFKCYPMKYFFKTYAVIHQKLLNPQLLIEQYIQNLKEQKCPNLYEKIVILLFLLPPKGELKLIKQSQFISILTNIIPVLNKNQEFIFYLTNIIFNAENFFIDYDLKATLDFLFKQCNNKNTSFFKLINAILDNNKISIISIDYIFTVLNYINSPNEEIRKISTSIFSKQMKIISILKFSDNYNQITEKNSDTKSLQFISNIFNQNINDMKELNVKLKISLRNYQLIGVNWLMFLGNYGLGLALCDDMGLGKSIQTLVAVAESTIEYTKKNKKSIPSLIICPNTLIMNWISESKKFFDDETLHIENDLKRKKINTKILIYICSYEKARDNFNEIFNDSHFYYLVLDEAHIIKNPKTKMYQAINKISAEKRIILTGTPIQNNVMELWALFNFLMPGFLGSENDFEIKYHKKMAQNIKKLNLQEDVQENIFQTSLQEIRKRIKPFILRRLKSEVLRELPEKIISDYNCEMPKVQRELYEKYNIMYNNNKLNTENSPLSVIDKLRKICDHPYLIENIDKKIKSSNEKEEMILQSGKLVALEELLISLGFESAMKSKSAFNSSSYENKLLIFTQMTKMCTLLDIFFAHKFPGLKVLTLTGDTKNKEKRGNIVDNFNNDPSVNVLILTINIGGLGLSLTSANVVIMYDHSWNPSKDMQAIDRAHRLGQRKIVQVFRLITTNSIEEQLISLQTFKKYISNNVVDTSKIHEDKVNLNSVMQSFEEFSKDKMNSMQENVKKKKKLSKYEEFTNVNEEDEMKEELEIAYLQKLIEK